MYKPRSEQAAVLERTAFEVSRAAEYFSLRELTSQTGQDKRFFANVVLKELLDNAIDAAEAAGINPKVSVKTEIIDQENNIVRITVEDNGPGIEPGVVQKILNFDTRTSTKQAYRSPTRGAQGNALKTLIGIPYALTGKESKLIIISHRTRHDITVTVDPAGDPRVQHLTSAANLEQGASFSIELPADEHYFRPDRYRDGYALFNPHLELTGNNRKFEPTVTLGDKWSKILPIDPTSPYWYTKEDFARLVYSYAAESRKNGDNKTLKRFISEFRGLSGRKKLQEVSGQFEGIKYLKDLENQPDEIGRLHDVMRQATKPVQPSILGEVGEEHFRRNFEQFTEGEMDGFRYKAKRGLLEDGLPYVVEVAFAETKKGCIEYAGINHAFAYGDPFNSCDFEFTDRDRAVSGRGFFNMIESMYDPYGVFADSAYIVAVHLICPRLDFKDRGKTQPVIVEEIRDAVEQALITCTRDVYKDNKRHANEHMRQETRERQQREKKRKQEEAGKIDKRTAVFLEIPEAVRQATGNFTLPASYRSVFYKIRPLIQKYELKTRRGKDELHLDYFRNLLKEYQQLCGSFPLVYAEPRGYLVEPHTGKRVDMGTREVAEYVLPENLFNKILYVEKLGLLPVFQAAKLAERYDCAIIAGQGFAVDAVKELLAKVDKETDITICVLTDADPAGYEIRRTLQEETRFTPGHKITVCDFGLTIAEAEKWNLESEEAVQKKNLPAVLMDRLTVKEAEYFLPSRDHCLDYGGKITPPWPLRRVELNAFASDELITYVESKFKEYGIQEKVFPGKRMVNDTASESAKKVLEELIQRAFMERFNIEEMTRAICDQVKGNLASLDVAGKVAKALQPNPPEGWHDLAQELAIKAAEEIFMERAAELVENYEP